MKRELQMGAQKCIRSRAPSDYSVQSYPCIETSKDHAVTIMVKQRLTEKALASAHLLVDRAYFFRKLKEAFLRESTSAQFGLKLLNLLDSADCEAEAHLLEPVKEVMPADEAQLLAKRRALCGELVMI